MDELTRRFKFVEMSSSLSFGYRDHFARMISPGAVSTEAAVLDSPGAAVLGDGNEKEFESGKKDEVDTSVYSNEL